MAKLKRGDQGPPPATWEQPLVTVDVVIFMLNDAGLHVLLMRRGADPFEGRWALPGGFIHPGEDADLEAAATRILSDKTGVASPYFEQLQAFGDRARDPRGWTVSFAFFALLSVEAPVLQKGANASDVAWWPIDDLDAASPLAFDHAEILKAAVTRLRNKVEYTSLPVHLLPPKFTLPDLQRVYENILGRRIDKSAFRKRMAEVDFLEPIQGEKKLASNRPAQFYRLKNGRSTIFFDRTI
jgi:8-oxo-dGTP diphosphatase